MGTESTIYGEILQSIAESQSNILKQLQTLVTRLDKSAAADDMNPDQKGKSPVSEDKSSEIQGGDTAGTKGENSGSSQGHDVVLPDKTGKSSDTEIENSDGDQRMMGNPAVDYPELPVLAEKGNWDLASRQIQMFPGAVKATFTEDSYTALHTAVNAKQWNFVNNLLIAMEPEDLMIQAKSGYTALHTVIVEGNVEVAIAMVTKYSKLTQIREKNGWVPLKVAADFVTDRQEEMIEYLWKVTRDEESSSPFSGRHGASLLCSLVEANFFDYAMFVVEKMHPNLGIEKNGESTGLKSTVTALEIMAKSPHIFCDGSKPKWFWQRWIYEGILVDLENSRKVIFPGSLLNDQANLEVLPLDMVTAPTINQITTAPTIKHIICVIVTNFKRTLINILRTINQIFGGIITLFGRTMIRILCVIQKSCDRVDKPPSDTENQLDVDTKIPGAPRNPLPDFNNIPGAPRNPLPDFNNIIDGIKTIFRQTMIGFHTAITKSCIPASAYKRMYNKKLMHKYVTALVKTILTQLQDSTTNEIEFFESSDILKMALKSGTTEFVVNCLRDFPDLIWRQTGTERILKVAVEERNHEVLNFMCGLSGDRIGDLVSRRDENENTILHYAAKLAPPHHLNRVIGAPLQMQREIQWFEGVKNLVPEKYWLFRNQDGKTAQQIFTEGHRALVVEAEKWLKVTAESCMLVTTLIATVTFAAAITVPGGNISSDGKNENNTPSLPSNTTRKPGIPIFLSEDAFMVFAIADGLSLFFSITSVLIFLSILTSRYAEVDFLTKLPTKLIFGLLTLFISIVTLMVAFGAALNVLLGKKVPVWAPILVACVPVFTMLFLQFTLFKELVFSTFRSSLIGKHKHRSVKLKAE